MLRFKTNLFDEFHCVGGACPHTCCGSGWRIDIDKKTEEYYRTLTGEFGQFVNDNIIHDAYGGTVRQRGFRCVFLNEDGLCGIQLRLGVEALGNTCRNYPRTAHKASAGVQLGSLTPSCPEVGRMLLERRNRWDLHSGDDGKDAQTEQDRLFAGMFRASFRLLQDRKLTIQERQKLFLIANQAFQEARSTGDTQKADTLLQYFSAPEIYRTLVRNHDGGRCVIAGRIRVLRELYELLMGDAAVLETSRLYADTLNYIFSIEGDEKATERLYSYLERLNTGKHEREQESVLLNGLMRRYGGEDMGGDLYRQAAYVVVFNQLLRTVSAFGSSQAGKLAPLDRRTLYLCFIAHGFEHSSKLRKQFGEKLQSTGMFEVPFLFQLVS